MNSTTTGSVIFLNGQPLEASEPQSVADLLRREHIDPESARGIAVAVNDEVVPQRRWSEVVLHGGDRVEIVTAKQGG